VSTAVKSKNVALSSIFDPYVAGTIKARTSGIKDANNDTSNLYANIIYGDAAAATGIKSQGADLNTLYAKIGTASYGLGFSGVHYSSSNNNADNLALICDTTSTWQITSNSAISGSPLSGSLNTYGAVTQVMLSNVSYDSTNATVDTITQNTWVAITADLQILKYRTIGLTGNYVTCTATVQFRNSGGQVLSSNSLIFNVWATNPQ
jgi:hypothetical protein